MDSLFTEVGIYAPEGQRYTPVDAEMMLSYKEMADGQILEEGISESGATAAFQAAATSYATLGVPMIPFYLFYAMFGFQRTGDAFWQLGDARGSGIPLRWHRRAHHPPRRGAPAPGRPQPAASLRPTPTSGLRPGLRLRGRRDRPARHRGDVRCHAAGRRLLPHPLQREHHAAADARRCRRPASSRASTSSSRHRRARKKKRRATVLFSGSSAGEALKAAEIFEARAQGRRRPVLRDLLQGAQGAGARGARRDPAATPLVAQILADAPGPLVAVSDYVSLVPTQIAPFLDRPLTVLGTDGVGMSDTREALRRHFGTDAEGIVAAVLAGLNRG